MGLEFLNHTPQMAFKRLKRELKTVDPGINLNGYAAMTPRMLGEQITKLEEEARTQKMQTTYGAWLESDRYVRNRLLREALEYLIEFQQDRIAEESMVPGFTYYHGVKQFGNHLTGERCHYLGESSPVEWVPFKTDVRLAKALEMLQHGDEDDFRTIYVEMADGTLNGLGKVTLAHVMESSGEALSLMEEFCDQRWDGAWPWESSAPYTLRVKINEKREHRMNVMEMKGRFDAALKTLRESEMEQYEALNAILDMMKQVDNMIGDLGKLSSVGIEASASVNSTGDSGAAELITQAMGEPVQQVAQSLTTLKTSIQQAVDTIRGDADMSGGNDMGGMGDDLGTPGDAMGAAPDGIAGDIADVNIDGAASERPVKDL